MKTHMKKVIIAYVPVLHDGYKRFFEKYKDASVLYILGSDIVAQFKPLTKDIRALDQKLVRKAILAWGCFGEVKILNVAGIKKLGKSKLEMVLPDEDVSRELAEKHLMGCKVVFENIFLRWDKHRAMEEKPITADQKISIKGFDKTILRDLKETAEKRSSDFWRRIGAAVVKEGRVVLSACNKHQPSEHSPYLYGDPRSNFSRGINIELSTSFHSESALIAEAARRGLKLEGADMYATIFPCPPCAKSVAHSGVKRLFYSGGYGVLDGAEILKSKGIEIIYVDLGK